MIFQGCTKGLSKSNKINRITSSSFVLLCIILIFFVPIREKSSLSNNLIMLRNLRGLSNHGVLWEFSELKCRMEYVFNRAVAVMPNGPLLNVLIWILNYPRLCIGNECFDWKTEHRMHTNLLISLFHQDKNFASLSSTRF